MDKELEQAIQTFGMAPEFYQKIFQDAGANFPDDLVTAIKEDPNKAGELVMSDNNLKNAIVSVFKQNKDALFKYIQQQNTVAMKNGGKFEYLDKLQKGGNLSRREALDYAQQNKGYTAEQARRAYLSAKNALRSQGLRGRELRQAARNDIAWTKPQEVNNSISESAPEIELQKRVFTPINNLEVTRNIPTAKVVRPARVANTPQSEKVILSNPNTATSSKGSLTRGPVYTVTPPAQNNISEPINITTLPESEQAAHDAYIKSLPTISNNSTVEPTVAATNINESSENMGILRKWAQLAKARWQADLAATRKAPNYDEQLRARRKAAYPRMTEFRNKKISYKTGGQLKKK